MSTRDGGDDDAEDLRLLDAREDSRQGADVNVARDGGAHPTCHGIGGQEEGLSRRLSVWDGVACNVGNMVGSGIFASPGVVLDYAGSVGLGLLAWVLGAALAAGR